MESVTGLRATGKHETQVNKKMRLRLFLSFALIILVSILGVVLIVRQNTTTAVRAFMVHGSMSDADELGEALQSYYETTGSWAGVESILGGQGRGRMQGQNQAGGMAHMGMMANQRLRLTDSTGNIIQDTASDSADGRLSAQEMGEALEIRVGGSVVGYLYAEGGMNFSQRDEAFLVGRVMDAAKTAALLGGVLSLLLALLLSYGILRPVRQLTQAAQKLGEGDLSQRVPVHGKDELASLAHTFNRMAASLEDAEGRRRSLTADIAHELRNPLAVQRANLEAMQDGLYPLAAETLQPVLEQNLFLTRLVEDLRMLALADAGELKLECQATNLAALSAQVIERYRPQADLKNIRLVLTEGEISTKMDTVWVDPIRIEQVLGNLLSNALRHTPEGGLVRLQLGSEEGKAWLEIHDSGAGIPIDSLDHIFDRFYRADRSRSRFEGGTGLGLAIARKLAEAHGGSLEASNDPAGGAVFRLHLPNRRKVETC